MWGRLKRRILRSRTGGGVYNSSHGDDEFSDSRDTYRDFREELYDDSRGPGAWKDGGKSSGKRMSLTKTPFPNLDRCSCGTPGARDPPQEGLVAKSETLRRKNDFILGVYDKSRNKTKGHVAGGKAKNEYTSTNTGPGTRGRRSVDGGEQRLRASTSTGQLLCSNQTEEEQAKNEWNNRRRNGHSPGAPQRRLAYSDDEDDDSEDEEEEDEDEEEEEEFSGDDVDDAPPLPSTSQQPFRNSSQSDGTKSSSNSSDYTSLAFDLNYVKVSPPKLRRRRKKNGGPDKNSAPLMVRRERRPFPELGTSSSDHLPPRAAAESKRPGRESESRNEATTTSVLVRLDGVGAGPPRGTSNDADFQSSPTQTKSDASCCRQPAPLLSSRPDTKQQQSSGYVAWADVHNPSGVISTDACRNILGSDRVGDERVDDERVPGRGCEISSSGSVLQFTFTVRLDNDVIRGTRRDVERSAGGPGGSSLVSGRVDILNQEKPGGVSVSGRGNILSQDEQHLHQPQQQEAHIPESLSLLQRSFKVQLQEEGAKTNAQNVALSQQTGCVTLAGSSPSVSTDPSNGFKDARPGITQPQRVVQTTPEGSAFDRSPKNRSVPVLGVGGRQQTVEEDFAPSEGSRMTTVAIVHKSSSDDGDREETGVAWSRTELGPTDGRSDYFQAGDRVNDANSGSSKAFDEVDGCAADGSRSHRYQSSPPPGTSSSAAEDGSELTHMSWDEVMKEAQSLGIPLSRPSGGSCDKARQPTTDQQTVVRSSSPLPAKQQGAASFQDVYWVCNSCTEAMQRQSSSPAARQKGTGQSKTSSPFKEKFKLQSIFAGSGSGAKKPKEERTCCKGQAMTSSPLNQKSSQSPGGAKYKTIPPTPGMTTIASRDVVLWGGQNCTCTTRRSLQTTSRQRSLSPVSTTRCTQVVQLSSGHWSRGGGDKRGQRIGHLCSPPLLRCRFSSSGRTIRTTSPATSMKKSAHLSSGKSVCSYLLNFI